MYTVRQRKLIPILCQCLLFAKLIIQKHLIPIFIMGEFNIKDFTYHYLDEQSQSLFPAPCKPSVILMLTQFLFHFMPFVIFPSWKINSTIPEFWYKNWYWGRRCWFGVLNGKIIICLIILNIRYTGNICTFIKTIDQHDK